MSGEVVCNLDASAWEELLQDAHNFQSHYARVAQHAHELLRSLQWQRLSSEVSTEFNQFLNQIFNTVSAVSTVMSGSNCLAIRSLIFRLAMASTCKTAETLESPVWLYRHV